MKAFIITIFLLLTNLYGNKFYYEYDKKIELDEVTNKSRAADGILEYTNKDGKTIKFRNEIIVQCEKNFVCEDTLTLLGIENYTKLSDNFFLVYVQKNQDIFELSQKLYEESSIKSAHPNFVKQRVRR